MNSFKTYTLLSRIQSQIRMFKHTRSHQLVLIRSYNSAQEKEVQAEKELKKYWSLFKKVVTDPSKKVVTDLSKKVVTDPSKKVSASKKVLSAIGVGLVFFYFYFTHESPNAQNKNMADVFKKGKIYREIDTSKKLVKRKNLENELERILQFSLQRYFLILGEHGTGKTTLVKNTILNLQEPKGVIHFECPSDVKEFANNLSKHLDCQLHPFKLPDIIVQLATNAIRKEQESHSEYSNWNLLSMQLFRTANYYMKKYNRPIVLVLDQVDRIAKNDPKFLGILQDFAKDSADSGTLVVVFVASEGLVPQIMKSRSAWSRAGTPFEVGDISDEEAVKFLQDSGVNKKKAEDAVKYLTGGRFTLLKGVQALNRVHPKNLFEKFKEQMFTQIKRDLDTIKLPANHEFFIKLIEVDRIDIQKAQTIIPLNMIHKLVEANILKEHQDYTVSFHSRYVDTYFKEVNKF